MTYPFDALSKRLFPPKASSHQAIVLAPSARSLNLVEILEAIFQHLNPSTLRHVSLVCKDWYLISQRFRVYSTFWQDSCFRSGATSVLGPDRNYSRQGRWTRGKYLTLTEAMEINRPRVLWMQFEVELFLGQVRDGEPIKGRERVNLEKLLEALPRENYTRNEDDPERKHLQQIRYLGMRGHVHVRGHLIPVLAQLGYALTRLEVHFADLQVLDLAGVLQACPRLSFLHLKRVKIAPLTDADDGELSTKLDLQNLILTSVDFAQPDLPRFLDQCPSLTEFRILFDQHSRSFIKTFYDEHALLAHLSRTCPLVSSCQISQIAPEPSSQERLAQMMALLPRLERVAVHDRDFTPLFFKPLQIQPGNRITTLEILKTPMRPDMAAHAPPFDDGLLHRFLCGCPTLLHLLAYDIFFDIQHFDPPQLGQQQQQQELELQQQWACHQLKTLQLSFMCKDTAMTTHQRARKVLKYLPRVCPHLVHLQLELFNVDLTIDSRLCLLAPLSRLETLGLGTGMITPIAPSDIQWLAKKPSPSWWGGSLGNLGKNTPRTTHRLWHTTDSAASNAITEVLEEGQDREQKTAQEQDKQVLPRLTRFRFFYGITTEETAMAVKGIQKTMAAIRPDLDFGVTSSPDPGQP